METNQDLSSTVTEEFNNQIQTIDQLKEKMDEQAKELKDLSAQVSSLKKEKDTLETKLLEKKKSLPV